MNNYKTLFPNNCHRIESGGSLMKHRVKLAILAIENARKHFGIDATEKKRTLPYLFARMYVVYHLRKAMPLTWIADVLCQNHATILNTNKRLEHVLENEEINPELFKILQDEKRNNY